MNKPLKPQNSTGLTQKLALPLSNESALMAAQIGEHSWNNSKPEQLITLFSTDSEWRDKNHCLIGKHAIQTHLQQKGALGLHYQTRVTLWAHSFSRLALCFESEWQHAHNGKWYRSKGTALVQLDNNGLIHELNITANDTPISANDRTIGFYGD
jgi:uncharacterized protein